MIYIKEYEVLPSSVFKNEMEELIKYIKYELQEPLVAERLYNKIILKIQSLKYMP